MAQCTGQKRVAGTLRTGISRLWLAGFYDALRAGMMYHGMDRPIESGAPRNRTISL
jgi:hypothetical protein